MNSESSLLPQIAPRVTHELASSSSAATAKALVEAKYTIALHRPRNLQLARQKLLAACKNPSFAATAKYAKPVGGTSIVGPSIRFAEAAIRSMGNIDVQTMIMHDDPDKMILNISVMDLEANSSYGDCVTINKTVERRSSRDRNVIRERTNSNGTIVYIVEATEDELNNKINAAKSKVIRNSGLRLVPQDIIDDAMTEVDRATSSAGSDSPETQIKKLIDGFAALRISVSDLEEYLHHPVDKCDLGEINDLRTMWVTIRDGEAKFRDYLTSDKKEEGATLEGAKIAAKKKVAMQASPAKKPELPAHVTVLAAISEANVDFDVFCKFVADQGLSKDTDSWASYDDVPNSVLEALEGDGVAILTSAKPAKK